MKVSEAYPREYLAASDVGNNQINVLISHVELRDLGDDTKPVVFFQNKKKGVVLNLVNAKAIEQYYGDEMDLWAGKEIILFTMPVTFNGRTAPAIRVRVPAPQERTTGPAATGAAKQTEDPADF